MIAVRNALLAFVGLVLTLAILAGVVEAVVRGPLLLGVCAIGGLVLWFVLVVIVVDELIDRELAKREEADRV